MPSSAALFLALAALVPPAAGRAGDTPRNVAILVADDVGIDLVGRYGVGVPQPCTPNIDRLANHGIRFVNAWSSPTCSPTRAQLLSGLRASQSGVGISVKADEPTNPGLRESPALLPAFLSQAAGYGSAALGKWHLAGPNQGPFHPLACGFEYYAGSLYNLGHEESTLCGPESLGYCNWEKTINGVTTCSGTYATSDTVDEAIVQAQQLELSGRPWLLYVPFNAVHAPTHCPGDPGLGCGTPGVCNPFYPCESNAQQTRLMMQALDGEVGRLVDALEALDPDVTIVFLGDNGTAQDATLPPFDAEHAKTTLYQEGIRVPLIVKGPLIIGGMECEGLVSVTDLYATVAELAGLRATGAVGADSISIVPYFLHPEHRSLRKLVYSERFEPNFRPLAGGPPPDYRARYHFRAVADERGFKLISRRTRDLAQVREAQELYDLVADPFETTDLYPAIVAGAATPEQSAHYAALRQALELRYPPLL